MSFDRRTHILFLKTIKLNENCKKKIEKCKNQKNKYENEQPRKKKMEQIKNGL